MSYCKTIWWSTKGTLWQLSYLTLAFTKRVLGRIQETWPWKAMNRDIHFPQFLHPTSGYKNWLSTDMRVAYREENDHKKSNKRKTTEWLSWYAPNFTFLHFMIPCLFNKGLECSKSPMKKIYHLIIWAMRESTILLSLHSLYFSFLFSMPCNFCPWCPCGNFRDAHGFFP